MKSIISIKSCLFGIFIFVSSLTFSNTIIVQNTDDEGAGSLRQAVRDAITGDTIRFDETLISSGNATIVLDSSIVYSNKGLTFKGLYNSTDTLKISGNNTNRIFTILQTQRTVIDSLVLFNGYANGTLDDPKGGAIFISNGTDTMFFNNSVFYDNVAVGNGGVIHNVDYGGNLHFSINNSTFKNNSGANGGALFLRSINNNSFVEITDSKFLNNSSDVDGGAIFIKSLENSYLNLSDSYIEGNSCSNGYGAGIFLDGVDSELTVQSSILKLNENLSTGNFHGGGAYLAGSNNSTIIINDSEISNNECVDAGSGFGVYAHAQSMDVTVNITNSIISDNSGSGSGSIAGQALQGNIDVNIDNSMFENNSAQTNAGALYFKAFQGAVSCNFYNDTVTNNNAVGMGGGIYLEATNQSVDVDFDECVISNNSSLAQGGGVLVTSSGFINIDFLNSNIENNTCNTGSGAGILVTADSVIFKLDNSFLNSNRHLGTSNVFGGGAYIAGISFANSTIIDSELKFNECPGGGAAIVTRTNGMLGIAELDINNSTVSNNIGGTLTGATETWSSQGSAKINLTNSTFNDNSTQNLGGAIYVFTQQEAEVNVTKCTVFGNSADANGGFIYLDGGTLAELNIKESTIVGNLTNNQGGAVYCFNSNPIATIKNSIISENTGTEQLYIYNSATNGLLGGISSGFNIFGNNQLGVVASDQNNVSAMNINLQPLALNGGTTQTMLPGSFSVALNAGDPNNISDAQNRPIVGRRDIGACEFKFCPNAPVINLAITNSSCGLNDGEVDATITGDGPFQTVWTNGETTEDIIELTPNTYYLTVTDNNNCESIGVANVTSNELVLTGSVVNNACTDLTSGEIDLTVTGTATPFTYQWTTGATTQDITNLSAGQYEVIVTDNDDCSSSMSFNVLEPNEFMVGFDITDAGCGVADGIIDLTITGGTGVYDFDWQDLSSTQIGTTEDLNGLGQGVYILNVSDANGCTFLATTQVSEIGAPTITVNSITNAGCTDNGAIDIEVVTTGTILSTVWSNTETTEDITGLTSGVYSVSVEDNNNCISNLNVEVLPDLPLPIQICLVTVDQTTGTNQVVWEKPISTTIDKFIIYRETSVAGEYLVLDSVDYDDESIYTDPAAFPDLRSWRYKISVLNDCGIESPLSPSHKTIHVAVSLALGGGFNLFWDDYEGFTYGTFDVWRFTTVDGWELIQSLSTSNFSLFDDPTNLGGLNYYIAVSPPSICQSTKAQDHNASRSNNTSSITNTDTGTDGISEVTNETFTAYPNPVQDELLITFENNQTYTIEMYNIQGDLVLTQKVTQQELKLNLSYLESGIYTMKVYNTTDFVTSKIVKL